MGFLDNTDAVNGIADDTGDDFGTPKLGSFLDFNTGNADGSNGGDSGGDSGDVDANGNRFDPTIHVGKDNRNADGSFRRKRGRRAGTSAGSGTRKASNNKAGIEALTRALAIVHLGIASATKTPEMVLEDSEAETLASAINNVMVEFDIKPDPKAEAIFGLVVAAGSVYGPRVYLIRERKKKDKANG